MVSPESDEQIERISVSIPLFSGNPMTQPDQGRRGEPLGVRQGEPQRGVQRLLHHQLPGAHRPCAVEGMAIGFNSWRHLGGRGVNPGRAAIYWEVYEV